MIPPEYEKKRVELSILLVEPGQSTHTCTLTFPFMQSARFLYLCKQLFFLHRKALARGQLLRLCMCVAPPIEYTWCQFKMTSLKCPYLSKPHVIILSYSTYIAMKHCTSHKTSTASYSPAHENTSSQILHIYGISVVICGGLPKSKPPQITTNHHWNIVIY